ncbi:MAG TPA: hypothetical protein VKF62_09390 [Planctomycetota bacterium]|nr:hypothetical protein [Planctomycetota bacterium]
MNPAAIILICLVVVVAIRVVAGGADKDRIAKYVEERGGRVIRISWAPFGKGWFGERYNRLYEVEYRDRNGDPHFATCKTSLLSGVYWTDDRVSSDRTARFDGPEGKEAGEGVRRLREENERLREELHALRRERDENVPQARS